MKNKSKKILKINKPQIDFFRIFHLIFIAGQCFLNLQVGQEVQELISNCSPYPTMRVIDRLSRVLRFNHLRFSGGLIECDYKIIFGKIGDKFPDVNKVNANTVLNTSIFSQRRMEKFSKSFFLWVK